MKAILFDFNGTLSDDEPLLCELYCTLFPQYGRPLTPQTYYGELAGLSEPEIVRTWLDRDEPALLDEFLRRYLDRARDGHTVHEHVRTAVRFAVGRAHLGVVSGALRPVVQAVLGGAGIRECFAAVVTAEDVERGKPDPAGYLRALALLDVRAENAAAIEDSPDGVTAAKAAGIYTVALLGTAAAGRLRHADEIVTRLDSELVERLLNR